VNHFTRGVTFAEVGSRKLLNHDVKLSLSPATFHSFGSVPRQAPANKNCASNFASRSLCQSFFDFDLVRQLEVHQDLGLDLHRIAVQVIRLILPLLDRFLRGASQHRISTHYFQIADVAGLGDGRLQLH